jgi:hypothetical protein
MSPMAQMLIALAYAWRRSLEAFKARLEQPS